MEHSPGPRRIIGAFLFLAMLAAFIPALTQASTARAAATASPFVTVTPPSTAPGNIVQIQACFAGSGGGLATVYLVAVGTTSPAFSTTQYNLDLNNCLGPTNFNTGAAPAAPAGNYNVVATFGTQVIYGTLNLSTSGGTTLLTVISPQNPIPANVNTPVTLSGSGFGANLPITVSVASASSPNVPIPGTTVVLGTSNAAGFYTTGYSVNLPAGSYFISATDGTHTDVGQIVVASGVTPGPNTLTVSPSTVLFTGQTVTVSGCFFTPFESVKLYLSTAPNTTGIFVTTVTANAAGCIGGAPNFTVPAVSVAGTYYIVAVGQTSGSIGSVTVTVNLTGPPGNTLAVVPNPAFVGQTVTASGCGYFTPPTYALEPVTLSVTTTGGISQPIYQQMTPTVTSPGCISVTFAAPQIGTYKVTLTGVNSANTDIGSLTVTGCSIYTTTCVCPVGSPTNCSCNPYNNTCNCSVYFNNCGCNSIYSNCVCTGFYNNTCCIYPYNTCNVHPQPPIYPPNTTAATLTAQPPNAVPGQTVTLNGTNFYPGGTVTITGLGTAGGMTTTAGSNGSFTSSLTVPVGTLIGNYTVVAQDNYGRSATTIIYVSISGGTLVANPASASAGQAITVTGTGFGPNEQVTLSLGVPSTAPNAITNPNTISIYTTGPNGGFSVTYVVPNVTPAGYVLIALGQTSRIEVVTPFTVTGAATPAPPIVPPGPVTPPINPPGIVTPLPPVASGSTTTYFADGYTGTAASNGKATFRERLDLYNNRSDDSDVTVTYYVLDSSGARSTMVKHMTVPAHSTASRSVNNDVGNDRQVSIVVRASNGVVAEIVISRVDADGQVLDNTSSTGTPFTDSAWYLAEGYTGESLQEYITLFNPGSDDAHALVKYLPSDTPAPTAKPVTVPARGQVTINVRADYNALAPQGSKNIGIQVTSDNEIVVDRAMYWGAGSGSGKFGYALGPGATSGHTTQYFAYLPTSNGSQSFVTVLNPEDSSADLTLTLRNALGSTVKTLTASVGPRRRYTFALQNSVANQGPLTGDLSSSNPVVAEAAIYFGGGPNSGAHPGIVVQGATGRGVGARAEISTLGGPLYVYNPTTDAVRVQVVVNDSNGVITVWDGTLTGRASKIVTVPAGVNPRGITLRASGGITAVLLNGGVGQPVAWGGTLS